MAIRVLDRATINKIAAGEVIERPASALKELLENSADSFATRVEIDFEAGGKSELKVTDDGCGIPAAELALALEPHATSKITSIEDLTSIESFGFRGEALASMAAVSELTLHSSLADATAGAKIVSHGGVIGKVIPAPPIKGTQVIVRNLFFNVPARQKFLKSDAGETAAIKKTVKQFALGHPELSITLRQGGRVVFHWEREDFPKRAARVLEVDRAKTIHLVKKEGAFEIEACLALPELNLGTQSGIWVFVQGRPVYDRTIQQSVLEGYRNLVMQNAYPQAVIHLSVDPSTVDVNVHPTKGQVKFADAGSVFRFVAHSLKEALAQKLGASAVSAEEPVMEDYVQQQAAFITDAVTQYNQRQFTGGFGNATSASASASESVAGAESVSVSGAREPQASQGFAKMGVWGQLQVVGQAANTYILCQSPKALVMVDQHAAHERVLFERLKRQFEENSVEKQASLIEELIELPRESIEALTEKRAADVFARLGFEFIDRGPTTLAVTTRPAFLADMSLKPLLEKVAEQCLEWGDSTVLKDVTTDLWASMACHGAIRAGRVLSSEEMKSLLQQMDEFAFSSFCPHGRPVSVQWTLTELEKLFKRIV